MRNTVLTSLVLAVLTLPIAAAQNIYGNPNPQTSPSASNATTPTPQESTTITGISGTALIVLVVLAVIVIALVVALTSRDKFP